MPGDYLKSSQEKEGLRKELYWHSKRGSMLYAKRYAEAKTEFNQIDQSVYDAINEVRQRAELNLPPITGTKSQEEIRHIVRHGRMEELAFE